MRGDRGRRFVVFVVPIVLAMIASAMRRYPFHGRLILELVPAFYLLIGLGAYRVCDRIAGLSRLGSTGVSGGASGAFPVSMVCTRSVLHPPRDHNQHGDLHKNLFLQYDYSLPIQPHELDRRQTSAGGRWRAVAARGKRELRPPA